MLYQVFCSNQTWYSIWLFALMQSALEVWEFSKGEPVLPITDSTTCSWLAPGEYIHLVMAISMQSIAFLDMGDYNSCEVIHTYILSDRLLYPVHVPGHKVTERSRQMYESIDSEDCNSPLDNGLFPTTMWQVTFTNLKHLSQLSVIFFILLFVTLTCGFLRADFWLA